MSHKEIISGARTSYGPKSVEKEAPMLGQNHRKQIRIPLLTVAGSATLLAADANDETVMQIPANSLVVDGYIYVKTAFAATTAVSITMGSESDPNGLITAAGVGAKAALTAKSWAQLDGALVGATWGTADESIIASWNAADATAVGEAQCTLEYIAPLL